MPCVIGLDIGSSRAKGILLREGGIMAFHDRPSGGNLKATADRVRRELLSQAGVSAHEVIRTIAAGHGAKQVSFADGSRSDVGCIGRGIHRLAPTVRTVVDVGDLYSKVVRIDANGGVTKFLLSGKCAGGSGRVLQVIAKVLQVRVEDIGPLSMKSRNRVDFNTGCVVFAESEAISRIAEGVPKEDLLAGIHRALAAQLQSLLERVGIQEDVTLVGGGARDAGLVKAMEQATGLEIVVPERPHLTEALGAALIAEEEAGNKTTA